MKRLVFSLVLVLGFLPATAFGQTSAKDAARDGWKAYKNGYYDKALTLLQTAANDIDVFDPPQQAAVYQYIAYCHVAKDRRSEATFAFKRALTYDPDLTLDPAKVSPRIMEAFEQAQTEMKAASSSSSHAELTVEPEHDATGALWRSAAAPGWGQLYSKRPVAGYVAMGANAAAIGTAIGLTLRAREAEERADAVRESTTSQPRILQQARDTRAQRNMALGAAAGIYVLTLVDAYGGVKWWGPHADSDATSTGVTVTPAVSPDGAAVFLTARF